MTPGTVVLARMPGGATGQPKLRPALLLATLPGVEAAALVCGISSRVDLVLRGWDVEVESGRGGLKVPSVIRPSWLSTLLVRDLIAIGTLGGDVAVTIRARLAASLLDQPA